MLVVTCFLRYSRCGRYLSSRLFSIVSTAFVVTRPHDIRQSFQNVFPCPAVHGSIGVSSMKDPGDVHESDDDAEHLCDAEHEEDLKTWY